MSSDYPFKNAARFIFKNPPRFSSLKNEQGNVLFIILLAIGLFAALTYTFVESGKDSLVSHNVFQLSQDLHAQARTIQSAVMECVLEYPEGDDPATNDNHPYPLSPSDTDNPGGGAADDKVENMECPGDPSSPYTLFGQTGKRFLPPVPDGFGDWTFINDSDGVRFQIIASASGPDIENALTQLDSMFSDCEAELDYNSCGSTCFNVWMIRNVACP